MAARSAPSARHLAIATPSAIPPEATSGTGGAAASARAVGTPQSANAAATAPVAGSRRPSTSAQLVPPAPPTSTAANGGARPYLAEIGLVGRAPGKYALYLGARYNGTRLNRLFAPSVTLDAAVTLLTPVIRRYALERHEGEGFGDFCHRSVLPGDATFHSVGSGFVDQGAGI